MKRQSEVPRSVTLPTRSAEQVERIAGKKRSAKIVPVVELLE